MKQLHISFILVSILLLSNSVYSQKPKPKTNSSVIIEKEEIPKPPPVKKPPASKGNLIISVDYACILKINGKVTDTLSPEDLWERKFIYDNLLLEVTLLSDKSIIIKRNVEINKSKKLEIISFKDEIEKKDRAKQDQEKKQREDKLAEARIQKENEKQKKEDRLNELIAEYKNNFSSASDYSEKLKSLKRQILYIDRNAGTTCNKCNGNGEIELSKTCDYCDGTAQVKCTQCKDGKVFCKNCQGYGAFQCRFYLLRPAQCIECGGLYGYHNNIRCSNCNGYGYLTCGTCNQTTFIKCSRCDNGSISYQACCKVCKGIGLIFK